MITSPSSEFLGMGHLALTGRMMMFVCLHMHTHSIQCTNSDWVGPYIVVRVGAVIAAILIRSTGLLYRSMVGRRGN